MTAPTPAAKRDFNPWLVLLTLCLGFFMILLDTTIVNIAIPDLSTGLSATLDQILWVINAYVLVYAVLLITAGRLGDLFGPKRLFLTGLVIFTLASAACGLAQSPTQLILFRIVQGVGGALLTPQTLSVLTMIFPPDRRGAAFGIWGAVAGVATVAGPTLGGWLVTDFGWRWIFFVNLPIGIATMALAIIVMPDLRLNRRHRLDLVGTALITAGLFLLTYGLIEGQPHHWGTVWGPITITMVIGMGLLLVVIFLYTQYAQRDQEPLIPMRIFQDRNFSLMNVVVASIGFSMLGLFLPLVIYLVSVLGLTPFQAGLTLAPMSLISMFVAPVAGRFADKIGGKWILFTGVSLFALGMGVLISSSHVDSTRLHLLPGLIVAGFGLGMTFAPLQTLAMRNINPQIAGAASGLINTTRQLGAVIGSASVGALLQAQLSTQLTVSATADAAALPEPLRGPFIAGFHNASAGNLEIGAGSTGAALPPGTPAGLQQTIATLAAKVFDEGFTQAMRVTLTLPIAVLALAALCVLLVKGYAKTEADIRASAPTPERPDR